jgi:hypothetical protein
LRNKTNINPLYRHFAAIGAVAVILALGFDPFIQNLVNYKTVYENDPASTSYLAKADGYKPSTIADQRELKGMISNALYTLNENWRTPLYQCNTGNCTWYDYSTLAVCERCADLSDKLTQTCQNGTAADSTLGAPCDYTLPNGMHLGADGHTVMAVNASRDAIFYTNYTNPLAIIQTVRLSGEATFANAENVAFASECALVPCIKTFNSSVGAWAQSQRAKISPDDMHGSPTDTLDYYVEYEGAIYDKFDFDAATGISLSPPEDLSVGINGSVYHISTAVFESLQTYIRELLQGSVVANGSDFSYISELKTGSSDAMELVHNNVGSQCGSYYEFPDSMGNLECTVRNIAQAATLAMRATQWLPISYATYTRGLPDIVSGSQTAPFTKVIVTWGWIALPIFIWLLSATMLLGTAWKTRKTGVRTWRTNPLALVFLELGRDEMKQGQKEHPMTEKGLAKRAEDLKVQLRVTGDEAVLENKSG